MRAQKYVILLYHKAGRMFFDAMPDNVLNSVWDIVEKNQLISLHCARIAVFLPFNIATSYFK